MHLRKLKWVLVALLFTACDSDKSFRRFLPNPTGGRPVAVGGVTTGGVSSETWSAASLRTSSSG